MARNANNKLLRKAKRMKSDEFYTQLCDIERELQHYQGCFRDKVVYCNCDDPHSSNFVRYFAENFRALGLKKLIASRYQESDTDLFHPAEDAHGEFGILTDSQKSIAITPLKGNGDFRSAECIELLKQADIIVTNPPFSLFREFVSMLMKHRKQFLVIGNVNAITYKEIFGFIQNNQAWLGVNLGRGISGFIVPNDYVPYGTEVSRDSNGQTIVATNGCLWLTNLELDQRNEKMSLTKTYSGNEDSYPRYDNCDGINVNRTQDIPGDYTGLMGVPITFLHKYNPQQFEIVRFRKGDDGKDLRINGKRPYFRIIIRNRQLCSTAQA